MSIKTPVIPNCRSCCVRASWDGRAYACPGCGRVCTNDPSGGPLSSARIVSKQEIVDYAHTWLDVPYTHQGRSRENGIDCIGLLRSIATHFELSNHDYFNYARTPDGKTLVREMDTAFGVETGYNASEPSILPYEPGDVLCFWIRKRSMPKHAGVFVRMDDGDPGIIHTYSTIGRVVKHRLNEWWLDRIAKVYYWPGVE